MAEANLSFSQLLEELKNATEKAKHKYDHTLAKLISLRDKHRVTDGEEEEIA